MAKSYKYLTRGERVYVVKQEVALFGSQWSEVGAFDKQCLGRCKQIVRLLNECDNITNKTDDRV